MFEIQCDFLICRYFKGNMLNPSLKYMPKYSGNEYELRIGRCKMEDKGEYIVKAVNSFGSKEECAALNVERTLSFLLNHCSNQFINRTSRT